LSARSPAGSLSNSATISRPHSAVSEQSSLTHTMFEQVDTPARTSIAPAKLISRTGPKPPQRRPFTPKTPRIPPPPAKILPPTPTHAISQSVGDWSEFSRPQTLPRSPHHTVSRSLGGWPNPARTQRSSPQIRPKPPIRLSPAMHLAQAPPVMVC
jgi:hypothetical protein